MTPEEIQKQLKYARQRITDANYNDTTTEESLGALIHAVELLTSAVEALAAHVASQATDGK